MIKIVGSRIASILTSASQKAAGLWVEKNSCLPKMMQRSGLFHIVRTAKNCCVCGTHEVILPSLLLIPLIFLMQFIRESRRAVTNDGEMMSHGCDPTQDLMDTMVCFCVHIFFFCQHSLRLPTET